MKGIIVSFLSTMLLSGGWTIIPCFGEGPDGIAPAVQPGKGDKAKVRNSLKKLIDDFNYGPEDRCAIVIVSSQRLYLLEGQQVRKVFAVSTSKYGAGNKANSNKTPLGVHHVQGKYGEGAPLGTVFKARSNTGRIAQIHEEETDLEEDLITTRILHLKGLEEGVNSGKGIDSYDRMIYIHGTPEEGLIGTPASHGCIRMKNGEVINVFGFLNTRGLLEIVK